MNEVTLPPSPNWYLSTVLACASDGTAAWGARNIIVIAKVANDSRKLDYDIIDKAHSERVTSVAFSPEKENDHYRLVSSGDENTVKLWNLKDMSLEMKNSKLDNNHKIIGVDWSKSNASLICFVSQDGYLVTWNINYDTSQLISLGKMIATCLACCPHDGNIVSVGSKTGLVYVVDIRGSGNVIYKMRGHDVEIVSLSWCPVPVNVIGDQNTRELLLASGAKDRNIFLWRAGSDGRCEKQIPIPTTPLDLSCHKTKVSASAGNYTALSWLEPTTLITNSPWGELLLWDLSRIGTKKYSPQLLHAIHGKGLFSIAGLADNCVKSTEDTENDNWRIKTSTEDTENDNWRIKINTESTDNDNWRMKTNLKAVWTVGQDRQVVCCSLLDSEIKINNIISTQGGFVYCISACPVDTSQIAFGVGDAMIRLWNLSEPHESKIELQMLWDKIKGKVSALAWHPEKENILAFGTNEGRIGLFDINVKKPPILYKHYHRRVVYRIGWGPAPTVKEYALYTCGDGELVYYNPEKLNDNPVAVIKKKDCTEFCWKPDYSLLALGFGDGSITFLNPDLSECGKTIHVLNKLIQCLIWHPESTSSDLNISPMQNYLAVATSGTAINIFDISNVIAEGTESDKSSFYKTVATLNGHSEKIVCLAWSPHISGYLVSGSYDRTAQVWKVEAQELIASYTLHSGPIQCCMWSPFSQDLVLTGAADLTLRMWSISKQEVLPVSKSSARGKRTKKKKTKELINGDNKVEIQAQQKEINDYQAGLKEDEVTADSKVNENKSLKKKKPKKITHFPVYAEIKNDNERWCSMVRALLNTLDNDSQEKNDNSMFDSNTTTENNSNTEAAVTTPECKIPVLLGNKKDLEYALNVEKNILSGNDQYPIVAEIDLWSGRLKENLQKATREKRLNEFLVSLAPSISLELWKEMCEAYAMQLISEENFHKAVSYFLCVNKVYEAIDVFVGAKLYKEAYVLASSRLDLQDPIIENVLRGWANHAHKDGHLQNMTECYLKLGDYTKAVKTLERRNDFESLILAIDIAESLKDCDLRIALAEKAILGALTDSKVEAAKLVIEKCPETQSWDIEIDMFKALNNALDTTNDETIIDWLKGSSEFSIFKSVGNQFGSCSEKYSFLIQKDICSSPTDEKSVRLSVSHQLALSITSDQEKLKLQHIVKALDIILQYEKTEFANNQSSILPKFLVILDCKNVTDPDSIFNSKEHDIAISLRSYLCYTISHWFVTSNLSQDKTTDCMNSILKILKTCVEDLFNKDSIKFWTTTNEISKLEYQLSQTIGKVTNVENDNVDETNNIVERLDQLKNDRKTFLNERISSPNPMLSYGAVMELLSQISDETVRQEMNEFVMNIWKKSIC